MTTPYRALAIVDPRPSALPAFAADVCQGCGAPLCYPPPARGYVPNYPEPTMRLCRGSPARGLWWWRRVGCPEMRPHVHVGHEKCGAEWICAPKTAAMFVGGSE